MSTGVHRSRPVARAMRLGLMSIRESLANVGSYSELPAISTWWPALNVPPLFLDVLDRHVTASHSPRACAHTDSGSAR